MIEDKAVYEIKKKTLQRLDEWKKERETGDLQLNEIADKLSDIIRESINIDNDLIPEIVGVLSAVVVGITGGRSVVAEVEMILEMARDYNNKKSKQH